MEKKMRVLVVVGTVLMNIACIAAPLLGDAVGKAVARAATHEVAEASARQAVKTGAAKVMSSALAGVTAKQAMGVGVAVGTAVALPVAAHEVADGYQDMNAAQADAIRETGMAAAQSVREHPEMATAVLDAVNHSDSMMDQVERMLKMVAPWGMGMVGVICLMYLLGFGLRSCACVRRGFAELRTQGACRMPASTAAEERKALKGE